MLCLWSFLPWGSKYHCSGGFALFFFGFFYPHDAWILGLCAVCVFSLMWAFYAWANMPPSASTSIVTCTHQLVYTGCPGIPGLNCYVPLLALECLKKYFRDLRLGEDHAVHIGDGNVSDDPPTEVCKWNSAGPCAGLDFWPFCVCFPVFVFCDGLCCSW